VRTAVTALAGSCHCGNLEVVFEPSRPPEELPVRACACSFCRAHGARTTTDPHGRVGLRARDQGQLLRYRFAQRTADFLVCRGCGVYVAAVLETDDGRLVATLNVNVLVERGRFASEAPVDYDGESEAARRARRAAGWTPVVWEPDPPGRG
jgi:hypothetical protein